MKDIVAILQQKHQILNTTTIESDNQTRTLPNLQPSVLSIKDKTITKRLGF